MHTVSESVKIKRNSLFSFLSMSSRLFTNIIIYWIVARFYGREIFGQFTSAQTIAIALILFADFGLDLLLTTELPRDIKNSVRIFNNFMSIKIILSSIAFIAMNIIAVYGNFEQEVKTLLFIFSYFIVFTTLSNFFSALYKGNEKLEYETFVNFIINFCSLVLILILITLKQSITIISLAFTITKLIGLIASLYFANRLLPLKKICMDFSDFRRFRDQVLIFGLFWIFGNLFFQLDTILLAFWVNSESVGTYQSVYRLIMLPLVIPDIFVNSLMPTLSRLNHENKFKWDKIGNSFNKLLIIISIPISVTLFLFPEQIIHLVYGNKDYTQAIPILRIFAVILFVRFFCETYGLMLTTSQRQKWRMLFVVVATLINFTINYFMIPRYGAFGASITSLVTNLVVCFCYVFASYPLIRLWFKDFKVIKSLFIIVIFVCSEIVFKTFDAWYLSLLSMCFYLLAAFKWLLTNEEKVFFIENGLLKKLNRKKYC